MPPDLTARVEATCRGLGLSADEARAIAERAAVWSETGKARRSLGGISGAVKAAPRAAGAPLRVYGWASVVDDGTQIVVDHDGDVIPARELERAVTAAGIGLPLDVDHRKTRVGRIVESLWLDAAKRRALGVDETGPTGWWIGAEVTDPATIARVEAGELPELSMRFARRRTLLTGETAKALAADEPAGLAVLTDLQIRDVSLVPLGAGRGVEVREQRKELQTMTPDEILTAIGAMPPEQIQALMAAIQKKFGEPAEPPEAAATPEMAAQKAREDAMKARLATLEEQIKRRDLVDALKARGLGDGIPGASLTEVADLLSGASPALRPVLDRVVAASAEQAKALATRSGLTGAGPSGGGDFDSLYEQAKARDPKADPATLIEQIKTQNPAAYAARYARS